jgi:Holliday junction DNA helicase RuvA
MIAFVSGRVAGIAPDGAVIEVGGVGLAVQCTPTTLATLRVGEPARLATSLVVREDSLTLFGFSDDDERAVFELVQTASGVGPRLAQAMLAVHSPEALRRAVATEDLASLTLVPGIGKKVAQRIVLELRDRLGPPISAGGGGTGGSVPVQGRQAAPAGWREQVHGALVGLGWSAREADEAIGAVARDADAALAAGEQPDIPILLKDALRALGSRR